MERLTTGATLGLSAAGYKAAVGVVMASSVAIGAPMTGDTATDVVTLATLAVGLWLHSKTPAQADAGTKPAKEKETPQ